MRIDLFLFGTGNLRVTHPLFFLKENLSEIIQGEEAGIRAQFHMPEALSNSVSPRLYVGHRWHGLTERNSATRASSSNLRGCQNVG